MSQYIIALNIRTFYLLTIYVVKSESQADVRVHNTSLNETKDLVQCMLLVDNACTS